MAVFQNGIEYGENFAPEYAALSVVIDTPAEQRADGSVLRRAPSQIEVENSSDRRGFKELFEGTSAEEELLRGCSLR